jgi:hypothetical protein
MAEQNQLMGVFDGIFGTVNSVVNNGGKLIEKTFSAAGTVIDSVSKNAVSVLDNVTKNTVKNSH